MNQSEQTRIEELIKKECGNTTGIMIVQNHELQMEAYFNEFQKQEAFHIFSITKSIISILIGIAIDHGYIESTQQKVLDFFPNYTIKKREKTIQKITIEDMLTMCAPYKYKFAPYTKYFKSDDWVHSALDLLGGKGTIGKFRYAPLIGPDILSGILVKATGQPVLAFAQKHLFEPLGISVVNSITFGSKEEQLAFYKTRTVSGWVEDPSGINTAGWGLCLTIQDMAKIGELMLCEGEYKGTQIVSKEWVRGSTKEHSRWEKLDLPYGYLWWVNKQGFAAMGDGGNIVYVNVSKALVVVMGAQMHKKAKNRMTFIEQYLEPLFS